MIGKLKSEMMEKHQKRGIIQITIIPQNTLTRMTIILIGVTATLILDRQ